MKSYLVYVCEHCKKESKEFSVIRACEAYHLGLSVQEYEEYEDLQKNVVYHCTVVSKTSNPDTRKNEDDVINKLLEFEKRHHIKT